MARALDGTPRPTAGQETTQHRPLPPEVIEAGVRVYERWYARGGQDDYAIKELVAEILGLRHEDKR